jgi:MarR family 2-MHQ and catechol resistance regulon transcriptional repressor
MAATATRKSLAQDVHEAINDLIRVYQFKDRDRVCCYDVSATQSYALDRIRRAGPLTLNELAAAMYIEKSSASRLVDGLVSKGYVSRRKHPDDGRTVLVTLTRSGERLAERIEQDMIREEEAILTDFSLAERKTIARALRALTEAAASRVDTTGGACSWTEPAA